VSTSSAKPRNALVIGLPALQLRPIRQALLGEGFREVFHAEDGAQAAAILASELVDVVFTREAGEGLRVRDVFGMMRGRTPNRRVPVILLDEGMPRPEVVSAIKAGAAGVLPVPAPPEAVRQLLGEIVHSRGTAAKAAD
jgi:PleD family two-component response regulator